MSNQRKIVIIGAGHVGSHVAMSLSMYGICDEIALIDIDVDKAESHAKDIADGTSLMPHPVVIRSGNYNDCDDADIVIISVGVSRKPGQTRLDMLDDTIVIMDDVMPKLCATKFNGILLTISNPADIIAHYAYTHSQYSKEKVFGTGTALDTVRLKRTLALLSGIDQRSISCVSMGEHGNSSMIPFSRVTLGGKRFDEFLGISKDMVLERTRMIGNEIIEGKGSTEFGIGIVTADMCKAILNDEKRVLPASALLEGEYGLHDLHIGVPVLLGENGIESIIQYDLCEDELEQLKASAEIIMDYNQRADKE